MPGTSDLPSELRAAPPALALAGALVELVDSPPPLPGVAVALAVVAPDPGMLLMGIVKVFEAIAVLVAAAASAVAVAEPAAQALAVLPAVAPDDAATPSAAASAPAAFAASGPPTAGGGGDADGGNAAAEPAPAHGIVLASADAAALEPARAAAEPAWLAATAAAATAAAAFVAAAFVAVAFAADAIAALAFAAAAFAAAEFVAAAAAESLSRRPQHLSPPVRQTWTMYQACSPWSIQQQMWD